MAVLVVPPLDPSPWPTLGPEVCDWIESAGVYGPGELKGEPYKVSDDFRAQLYRAYEVYPRGHRLEGRRRFKRVCLEERKGTAKTERAMLVALLESHPDAPVRCDGFKKVGRKWEPVGRGVRSPYIPLVSYTVEQTEDLGWNVLRAILEDSPVVDRYDIGLERILVLDERGREAGKIVPLAGSPGARDGARTTFQHFDEPHRMTLPRLVKAHSTMIENTYKRVGADAWTLETTTAGELGEGSVAEETRAYAESVDRGEVDDPRLFFFSRFAPLEMPLDSPEETREALLEASGPNAEWSGDIDALVSRRFEPKVDLSFWRRVWLNQWVPGGAAAFDPDRWADLSLDRTVPLGALITLGLDGATRKDSTALVATEVETGYQWPVGIWSRPPNAPDDWEVDHELVDLAVTDCFDRFEVVRFYADPPYWWDWVAAWAGRYGEDRVKEWWTNRRRMMAQALRAYRGAIIDGAVSHNGDPIFAAHIAHSIRKNLGIFDEDGTEFWVITKERSDSDRKIDAAMAGCLSWEARVDAIAKGALKRPKAKTFGSR